MHDIGGHTPSPRGLQDVIPSDKEEKMDMDSGYDPNPPIDSDLDKELVSELLGKPKVVMPGMQSDDSVTLGIIPGDMETL